MKKTLTLIYFILVFSIISNAQDMNKLSEKVFISMSMNDVTAVINELIEKRYLYPDYGKRYFSIKVKEELKFVAYFDEDWNCMMTILQDTDENMSKYIARAINMGYTYDELKNHYVNKNDTIAVSIYELNSISYWKTIKLDYL